MEPYTIEINCFFPTYKKGCFLQKKITKLNECCLFQVKCIYIGFSSKTNVDRLKAGCNLTLFFLNYFELSLAYGTTK